MKHLRRKMGMVSLRVAVILAVIAVAILAWWTIAATSSRQADGREELVCWGITFLGDDVYNLVHDFEVRNPTYRVVISSSVERDTTSDGQRLLSAIAGGVPPDVVFFPRFSTGEW